MQEAQLRSVLERLGIRVVSRSSRGWLNFHCPLAAWTHQGGHDRRPSAAAKPADGPSGWTCLTCKNHGRITSLVVQLGRKRGQDLSGLLREVQLAELAGEHVVHFGGFDDLPAVEPAPEPLEEAVFDGLYPAASGDPEAAAYLAARGIGGTTADSLGLLWDGDPRQRRVLFPVRDHAGRLFGFTGRAVDPETSPKIRDYAGLPKRHLVLGAERWRSHRPLILVEGLFGYAALIERGVERLASVGAVLGSVLTPEKAQLVRGWGEATYLLFDNDEAGEAGLFGHVDPDGRRVWREGAVARLLDHVPVFVPAWPEGKDDPDQLTLAEVETMLAGTSPWSTKY